MKITKLAALAVLSGIVFSCSSDDGATTSGNLLGKWYNKESRIGSQVFPYDDHEPCGKDYIEFKADGSGAFVDIYECNPYSDPFLYVRNGNNVTVTTADGPETAEITELSSTTLKVKVYYDYDGDGDDDTITEIYTRN